MNRTTPSPLIVPLNSTIRDRARHFAAQQATPEKGLRVYLNTLAVWAVHRYLKWLHIEADMEAGDLGNAALRAIFDVADLMIPDWGKLECRPVLEGEDAIALSPEATQGRRGYVAIRLNPSLKEAQILGFYPSSSEHLKTISLHQLQPLESLLDSIPESNGTRVCLSQWLQNTFSPTWQAVETLLSTSTIVAFRRNTVWRAKRLELATPLILLLTLELEARDVVIVYIQLLPGDTTTTLPYSTQLIVLTETGEVFRAIESREGERFISYELSGERGESFKLKVVSEGNYLTESFTI
ncbi:MAG: DUF1822 family protein [Cyanobacteriota bacterium]|nr:DUF1822 family protein [Cyanobacteriota bacterium]